MTAYRISCEVPSRSLIQRIDHATTHQIMSHIVPTTRQPIGPAHSAASPPSNRCKLYPIRFYHTYETVPRAGPHNRKKFRPGPPLHQADPIRPGPNADHYEIENAEPHRHYMQGDHRRNFASPPLATVTSVSYNTA